MLQLACALSGVACPRALRVACREYVCIRDCCFMLFRAVSVCDGMLVDVAAVHEGLFAVPQKRLRELSGFHLGLSKSRNSWNGVVGQC